MTPQRLPYRSARLGMLASVLVVAGLASAWAQFLPGPGRSAPPGQFPPAGGTSDPAFPPPPGQPAAQPAVNGAPAGADPTSAPGGFSSGPQSGGFSGGPPSGGFGSPGPGGQPSAAQKICTEFPAIRKAAEEGAAALRSAGQRKAPREEVCELFKSFSAKEGRLLKFLVDNQKPCGVPPQAITGVKANHNKTLQISKNVCSGGGPAAAPSLSDALGGPIIADDTSAKQKGRGTFDTLTGNVLSR
jgi:hypothetical protein